MTASLRNLSPSAGPRARNDDPVQCYRGIERTASAITALPSQAKHERAVHSTSQSSGRIRDFACPSRASNTVNSTAGARRYRGDTAPEPASASHHHAGPVWQRDVTQRICRCRIRHEARPNSNRRAPAGRQLMNAMLSKFSSSTMPSMVTAETNACWCACSITLLSYRW